MTQDQFEIQIQIAASKAKLVVMQSAPVRTGNLMNSIKIKFNTNGFTIYIDQGQSPYMMYTEETWKSPSWAGRANPNEGWFEEAAEAVARTIAAQFGSSPVER